MGIALITGCSSGIGKLSALEFARRGYRVYASMRTVENAGYLRAAADAERLAIETIELDVTDTASVKDAVAQILERDGRIDILVNNAGFGAAGPVEDYDDDEIRQVFETNFFGAVRVTRAVLPAMRAQRSGTIVMVSSISGLRTFPFMAVYSASKFALEAISNGLRYELWPFGIRVVLVEPGNFKTRAGTNMYFPRRVRNGAKEGTSDPFYTRIIEHRIKTGAELALGDANDVARMIVDAAAAKNPNARYLVGGDAQELAALSPEDFERMIEDSMKLPE
ncbi:MAG: SDR family oxidoreductase [Candidatus Binataceae bacterium]